MNKKRGDRVRGRKSEHALGDTGGAPVHGNLTWPRRKSHKVKCFPEGSTATGQIFPLERGCLAQG